MNQCHLKIPWKSTEMSTSLQVPQEVLELTESCQVKLLSPLMLVERRGCNTKSKSDWGLNSTENVNLLVKCLG